MQRPKDVEAGALAGGPPLETAIWSVWKGAGIVAVVVLMPLTNAAGAAGETAPSRLVHVAGPL
jgi:hypothetical protein